MSLHFTQIFEILSDTEIRPKRRIRFGAMIANPSLVFDPNLGGLNLLQYKNRYVEVIEEADQLVLVRFLPDGEM